MSGAAPAGVRVPKHAFKATPDGREGT